MGCLSRVELSGDCQGVTLLWPGFWPGVGPEKFNAPFFDQDGLGAIVWQHQITLAARSRTNDGLSGREDHTTLFKTVRLAGTLDHRRSHGILRVCSPCVQHLRSKLVSAHFFKLVHWRHVVILLDDGASHVRPVPGLQIVVGEDGSGFKVVGAVFMRPRFSARYTLKGVLSLDLFKKFLLACAQSSTDALRLGEDTCHESQPPSFRARCDSSHLQYQQQWLRTRSDRGS